jgi:hypothetical protein
MNRRLLLSATFFLTVAQGCWCPMQVSAQAPKRINTQASRNGAVFTLLSWRSARGDWYFILRTQEQFDATAKQDLKHRLPGVAALKKALAKLPPRTGIFWSNSRAYGYEYPPDNMAEDIRMFAKRRGINLQYNPALE